MKATRRSVLSIVVMILSEVLVMTPLIRGLFFLLLFLRCLPLSNSFRPYQGIQQRARHLIAGLQAFNKAPLINPTREMKRFTDRYYQEATFGRACYELSVSRVRNSVGLGDTMTIGSLLDRLSWWRINVGLVNAQMSLSKLMAGI
jgi:hypothetical protein